MLATLGVDATVAGTPVRVVFDRPYIESLGIAGNVPVVRAPTAQMPGVAYQSPVIVSGQAYRVTVVQADGTGWTTLALEEAV